MAKSLGALACLITLPCLAFSQSLGDAAKKERERREKVRESGTASPTVTTEDLANNKGSLANDPKTAPAPPADHDTPKKSAGPASVARDPHPDTASTEEGWRARAVTARQRIVEAERRSFAFQRMIHIGQAGERDENGRVVIYSTYQLKKMADAADAELLAAKKDFEQLEDDARRAGVPPGWLR